MIHCPTYEILITSISKKIPLIKAVRLAARRLGVYIALHGTDSDPNCVAKYEIDVFWHAPFLKDLTIHEILHYCKKHSINAIIPTRNEDVEFYSHHLEFLKNEGISVMTSSVDTVNICLDKKKFADILTLYHIPIIGAYLSLNDLNFPSFVVKERFGAGAYNIGLNLSKSEAKIWANKLKDPIFQPFISGKEWSVDLYRSLKGNVLGIVARERNVVERGESKVTTTRAYPLLEALCEKIASILNLYGHAVIQVIEDENHHFHVIECNPRFGGASTASLAVGLDSFYWFLLECLKVNIEKYPFLRTSNEIRQIRYPADKIIPWI